MQFVTADLVEPLELHECDGDSEMFRPHSTVGGETNTISGFELIIKDGLGPCIEMPHVGHKLLVHE